MPYIRADLRPQWDSRLTGLIEHFKHYVTTPGDLNYIITRIIYTWLRTEGLNYAHLSAVRGVLADVSDELYRRVMVPYENAKLAENGDVYGETT